MTNNSEEYTLNIDDSNLLLKDKLNSFSKILPYINKEGKELILS